MRAALSARQRMRCKSARVHLTTHTICLRRGDGGAAYRADGSLLARERTLRTLRRTHQYYNVDGARGWGKGGERGWRVPEFVSPMRCWSARKYVCVVSENVLTTCRHSVHAARHYVFVRGRLSRRDTHIHFMLFVCGVRSRRRAWSAALSAARRQRLGLTLAVRPSAADERRMWRTEDNKMTAT